MKQLLFYSCPFLLCMVFLLTACQQDSVTQTSFSDDNPEHETVRPVKADAPTDGWTQESFDYYIQKPWDLDLSDRYEYDSGTNTHRMWVYDDDEPFQQGNSTDPRTEMRWNEEYSSGQHMWEADVYIHSGTAGSSVMQILRIDRPSGTPATDIMLVAHDDNTLRRYFSSSGALIKSNIYDNWWNLKVEHNADTETIRVYADDQLVLTVDDRGPATRHFKNGVYGVSGRSEVEFRDLKYWRNYGGGSGGPVSNGTYKITAKHSGKAMVVEGASTADNANIFQYTYGGSNTNDEWIVTDIGNGYYSIINDNSGKALSINSGGTERGLNAKQYTYNGWSHQKYELEDMGGGYYRMRNTQDFCIDVEGAGTSDEVNILQWDCHSNDNQQWLFTEL